MSWNQFALDVKSHGFEYAISQASNEVIDAFNDKIMPEIIGGKKIQAIKALRNESGFGLKEAKDLVDLIPTEFSSQGRITIPRFGDPKLIDAIEEVEHYVKRAIRFANNDDKTASAMLAMKDQLQDLWSELVELPQRPSPRNDEPRW